jgi:UDP-glucose 4-epimerase
MANSRAKATVLVVGGAGFIGSHTVKHLADRGFEVTTLDNLSTGHRDAVLAGDFIHADLLDREALGAALRWRRFDAVVHFAAFAYVGESVTAPRRYWSNNVVGTLNLLAAMLDAGVDKLVFSSTCATYGVPLRVPIEEDAPQIPINPYGETKLVMERAMRDYAAAYGLASIALRYFNAAGADSSGRLWERHEPETHLVPLVLREAARVRRGGAKNETDLAIFGTDYPTPDGTCVRDYVHVEDLASAHALALSHLLSGAKGFDAFNLSTEQGLSVLEILDGARRVTRTDFEHRVAPRRPGDPPVLVGSARKAREVLGWKPQLSSLDSILETAWRSLPNND